MDKFSNYVYLSICEISVKLFHKSKFSTYHGYCISMRNSLLLREFNNKEVSDLCEIGDYLVLLYNLGPSEIGDFIDSYFNYDNINDLYKYVKLVEECYPLSHD